VRIARNVAILALIAVPVAFVPAGGDAAEGTTTALQILFLAALGAMGFMIYRRSRFTLETMNDGHRALLYGCFGLIVLLIAQEGNLLWVGLMIGTGAAIFWLMRESQSS
jgi:hypothetical protein